MGADQTEAVGFASQSTSAMPRLRPKSCGDATYREGPIGDVNKSEAMSG
jgi:hypothetical protein